MRRTYSRPPVHRDAAVRWTTVSAGADLRAVRLRVGADRLRADDDGERGEGQGRALARGASGGQDQAVGDEEEQPAVPGGVRLGDPETADGGELDDLPGRGGGPGERGADGPAPHGGTGAAADRPDELPGEQLPEVHGERGEQDGTEQGGEPRAGYPQLPGAACDEPGSEQGHEERQESGGGQGGREEEPGAAAGAVGGGHDVGRHRDGRCPRGQRWYADGQREGRCVGRHSGRRRVGTGRSGPCGRIGGSSGEHHGSILSGGQTHGKRHRPPAGPARPGVPRRLRPCSARPRTRRR